MKFTASYLFSLTSFALRATAINGYDRINQELNIHDDSDLLYFESRPELRAPRLNTVFYDDETRDTSAHYFTAPYVDLLQRIPTRLYSPLQNGPHIYNQLGELVWSGAALFPDRPTFDFKVGQMNGQLVLSFILGEDDHQTNLTGGAGIILDTSYNITKVVKTSGGRGTANMHEFTLVDDGKSALIITFESTLREKSSGQGSLWLGNGGFQEIEVETGKILFEWWALDHVDPLESEVAMPTTVGGSNHPWDFFHMNSVDKDVEGNYIISARFMNAVYKISGEDGSIMWTLGGKHSSFDISGFNFSSQHDARLLGDNVTTTLISFFNNHSNGIKSTATKSTALVVALDKKNMTATLVNEYARPDGELTHLRGNAQLLREEQNGMFICWSENSYMSQYTQEGRLLMEASFASKRFQDYRAYKFRDFVGAPLERPTLVAKAYGVSQVESVTVMHVSWNGATDVDSWNFYRRGCDGQAKELIGSVKQSGFESSLTTTGYATNLFAEAVDAHGDVLQTSETVVSRIPGSWATGSADICQKAAARVGEQIPKAQTANLTADDDSSEEQKSKPELQTQTHSPVKMGLQSTVAYVSEQHPYRALLIFLGCILAFTGVLFVRRRRQRIFVDKSKLGLVYV